MLLKRDIISSPWSKNGICWNGSTARKRASQCQFCIRLMNLICDLLDKSIMMFTSRRASDRKNYHKFMPLRNRKFTKALNLSSSKAVLQNQFNIKSISVEWFTRSTFTRKSQSDLRKQPSISHCLMWGNWIVSFRLLLRIRRLFATHGSDSRITIF